MALIGNLGGRLTSGQVLSYPASVRETWGAGHPLMGKAGDTNPVINALYRTILHAIGKPRDTFNRSPVAKEPPAAFGPLKELLA